MKSLDLRAAQNKNTDLEDEQYTCNPDFLCVALILDYFELKMYTHVHYVSR